MAAPTPAQAEAQAQARKTPPRNAEESMRARYEQQEKVFAEMPREKVRIREELAAQRVQINGYDFVVPSDGKFHSVPKQVADILRKARLLG